MDNLDHIDLDPTPATTWENVLEQLNRVNALDLDAEVDVADMTADEITPSTTRSTNSNDLAAALERVRRKLKKIIRAISRK